MVRCPGNQLRRTAEEWLQIARDAREVAEWLSDPQAKHVLENVA
jgi:hypothetical protein